MMGLALAPPRKPVVRMMERCGGSKVLGSSPRMARWTRTFSEFPRACVSSLTAGEPGLPAGTPVSVIPNRWTRKRSDVTPAAAHAAERFSRLGDGGTMRNPRVMKGAAILLLCIMLASSIAGCTAIGFAVGARADSRKGTGGPELLGQLKVGQPVTLVLHDGRKLEGRFSGWSRDSDVASSAADSLPLRKESVKLASASGEISIPAGDIARVSVSVSRGKVTGLLVGAVLDALVILAFVYGMEQSTTSAYGQ